ASFAVSPTPSAAFSPFTTEKPAPSPSRGGPSRASSARRPGGPKTSAMKRMTSAALLVLGHGERAGCVHLDVHVLAAILGVARECGLLHGGKVDDAPDLRPTGRDGCPDGQRWICLEVGEGDDDPRVAGRLDVD